MRLGDDGEELGSINSSESPPRVWDEHENNSKSETKKRNNSKFGDGPLDVVEFPDIDALEALNIATNERSNSVSV